MIRHALFLLGTTASAAVLSAQDGAVAFGEFRPAASGEFVQIHLPRNLIQFAARLAAEEEPAAAELLRGINGVHVNVVSLDDSNREATLARVEDIRAQLAGSGWERIVRVQDPAGDDVAVFLKTRGEEAIAGLVVTVIEGTNQAVLINIDGDIAADRLVELGRRLHVPQIEQLREHLHAPPADEPAATPPTT